MEIPDAILVEFAGAEVLKSTRLPLVKDLEEGKSIRLEEVASFGGILGLMTVTNCCATPWFKSK
jgi:hypothetical protein